MKSGQSGRARLGAAEIIIVIVLAAFCVYALVPSLRVWIYEHLTGRGLMR